MTIKTVAELQTTRRYLLSTLLNLPVQTSETSVASLLVMLDYFIDNPREYLELTNVTD